jgi:hypothetical protein
MKQAAAAHQTNKMGVQHHPRCTASGLRLLGEQRITSHGAHRKLHHAAMFAAPPGPVNVHAGHPRAARVRVWCSVQKTGSVRCSSVFFTSVWDQAQPLVVARIGSLRQHDVEAAPDCSAVAFGKLCKNDARAPAKVVSSKQRAHNQGPRPWPNEGWV